jgi:hypothetical protein
VTSVDVAISPNAAIDIRRFIRPPLNLVIVAVRPFASAVDLDESGCVLIPFFVNRERA